MTRVLPLAFALAVLCFGSASAEEAISTANSAQRGPDASAGPPAPPLGSSMTEADDEDGPRIGPCGAPAVDRNGKPDRRPRGEVEVGVGTNGYRHVAGAVCKPVGDNGAVVIAVDHSEWNAGHRLVGEGLGAEQLRASAP